MSHHADARREQARGNGVAQAGQFGYQSHSAPGAFDAGVGDASEQRAAEASIDVLVGMYGRPTSRHRKDQSYEVPGVLHVTIPVIDADDAPRAMTLTRPGDPDGLREIVLHDGRLFTTRGRTPAEALAKHDRVRTRPWLPQEPLPWLPEDNFALIQDEIDRDWVVIDGAVYEALPEPTLRVFNGVVNIDDHSGISGRGSDARGFLRDPNRYRLDEYETTVAVAAAERETDEYDHSICLDFGPAMDEYESEYRRPPVLDYDRSRRRPAEERNPEAYAADLERMRASMAKIPGAITRVPDGFGGTRGRVDWSLFSVDQEDDYNRLIQDSEEPKR